MKLGMYVCMLELMLSTVLRFIEDFRFIGVVVVCIASLKSVFCVLCVVGTRDPSWCPVDTWRVRQFCGGHLSSDASG